MENLFAFLEQSAEFHGEKVFSQIREGDHWRTLSFRQLQDSAEALARALKGLGCHPGDRVAILSENRPEWGIAFFAALRIDAVAVPLDKLLKKGEIESILRIAKPHSIIASKQYLELLLEIPDHPPILCLDGNEAPIESLAGLIEKGLRSPALEKSSSTPDSTAVIIFTSGTTGNPKGVMLSHGNFLSNVKAFGDIFPRDFFRKPFLSTLPLNHSYEITAGFLTPLGGGGTVTYLDSLKPNRLLETMRETKTEIMLSVPALFETLKAGVMQQIRRSKRTVRKFNFAFTVSSFLPWRLRRWIFREIHAAFGGNLRFFVSGGAPLSAEVQDFFERLGIEILQGYGLTETGPVLTVNPLGHTKKNSVGKTIPDVQLKIAGETQGEIAAKGPNVMKGYYENPQATREVLKDGYFSTGDLGYFDRQGYLYISGRVKNLIVSSAGKKVSPEEIEEKLKSLPYAKEVCVLGRKQGFEESVVAVVVPDREKLEADGIPSGEARGKIWDGIKKINSTMADFKRVSDLVLWDEDLPKTTTLKVKRRELQRLLENK